MSYYQNKIAIVTGGGSGIGRALCLALAQQGAAAVIVSDLNKAEAEKTTNLIRETGAEAATIKVDVSRQADVESLVRETVSRYGRLDLMFNNAGISLMGEMRDIHIDHWQRIIDVDLWGAIYGTHYAYQQMLKQGSGHIINTASAAGIWPAPTSVPYGTAKHGVVGLSTSLRAEAKKLGIRVSVVCPGFIDTPIFGKMSSLSPMKEGAAEALAPANNFALMSPEQCAALILRRVARNHAVIPVTAFAEIFWRVYRYLPALAEPMLDMLVDSFRKYRQD